MNVRMAVLTCASFFAISVGRSAWAQPVTQKMEESLASVEAALTDVEQKKVITGAHDVGAALHAYAQTAYDTYSNVTDALRATPNQTTLAQLKEFEDRIQTHKARAEKIMQRIANIHVHIRDGNITIGDQELKNADQEHINELKQWLKPDVRDKYRARDPRFGQNLDGRALPEQQMAGSSDQKSEVLCEASHFRHDRHDGLLLKLGDLLVPRAYAAVAFGCYYICANALTGCVPCIVAAGGFALNAWNFYQTQVAKCGVCPWWDPRCGLCRHFALQALLSVLA